MEKSDKSDKWRSPLTYTVEPELLEPRPRLVRPRPRTTVDRANGCVGLLFVLLVPLMGLGFLVQCIGDTNDLAHGEYVQGKEDSGLLVNWIGTAILLAISWFGFRFYRQSQRDDHELAVNGLVASASVIKMWQTTSDGNTKSYHVQYEFFASSGNRLTGTEIVSREEFDRIKPGYSVTVLYRAEKPDQHSLYHSLYGRLNLIVGEPKDLLLRAGQSQLDIDESTLVRPAKQTTQDNDTLPRPLYSDECEQPADRPS
jgi:hypothetical protein